MCFQILRNFIKAEKTLLHKQNPITSFNCSKCTSSRPKTTAWWSWVSRGIDAYNMSTSLKGYFNSLFEFVLVTRWSECWTNKKFPWWSSFQQRPSIATFRWNRPPGAHEWSSPCTLSRNNQAECPIQNIRCKHPVKQEYVIPAWILHICISSASPRYD